MLKLIPRFGVSRNLQSDNGHSFTAKRTQQVASALGIKYSLYSSWRSQPSGKVEKANHVLKKTLAKLCQTNKQTKQNKKTWDVGNSFMHYTAKSSDSPKGPPVAKLFWNGLWKALLTSDLYFNEVQQMVSHVINLDQVKKALQEYTNNILSSPSKTQTLQYN